MVSPSWVRPCFYHENLTSSSIIALYNPHGRYRFDGGCNWRAAVAFIVPVAPSLPGLAYSITPSISISQGAKNLYTFDWLFGFVVSIFLYTSLSWLFPAKETLLTDTIWNNDAIEGVQATTSGSDIEKARGPASIGRSNENGYEESDAKPL